MTDNVTSITAALKDAKPAPDVGKTKTKPGSGGDQPRHLLPPGAPIRALGKQGVTLWLLDHLNQLQSFKPRELGKGELVTICGDLEWLMDKFPRYSKPSKERPIRSDRLRPE